MKFSTKYKGHYYNVLRAYKLIIIKLKKSSIKYKQSNYQGENIHLFKRMNKCSNSYFQELEGYVGSTVFFFFNFKSVPWRKESITPGADVGLAAEGMLSAVRFTM